MAIDSLATEGLAWGWVIAVGVITLLVGAAIGFLVGGKKGGNKQVIADLENQLAEKDQEMTSYRAEVVNQFSATAEKFKSMDESYHALHRQLATSAVSLCGDQAMPLLGHLNENAALEDSSTVAESTPVEGSTSVEGSMVIEREVEAVIVPEHSEGEEGGAEAVMQADAVELDVTDEPVALDATTEDIAVVASSDADDASQSSTAGSVKSMDEVDVPILTEDVASDDDEVTKIHR